MAKVDYDAGFQWILQPPKAAVAPKKERPGEQTPEEPERPTLRHKSEPTDRGKNEMSSSPQTSMQRPADVTIRLLREKDLVAADHIIRLAFGTFLGLPDPMQFMGDADYARTRWRADPFAALGAEVNGEIVGSNFVTRWGSVGFFGPLTIRPDLWDRGVAQQLLRPTMDLFEKWGVRHAGLFTFAASVKHVRLYQKFGFWPRFLTTLMEIPIPAETSTAAKKWARFSDLTAGDKELCVQACRKLTNSIYEGLDVQREIRAVDAQRLGDTVLTWGGGRINGFRGLPRRRGNGSGQRKVLRQIRRRAQRSKRGA